MSGRGRGKRDEAIPTRQSERILGKQPPTFGDSAAALENVQRKKKETEQIVNISSDSSESEEDVIHAEQAFEDALNETPTDADNMATNCPLSAFWRAQPSLWFLQSEALFEKHRVTDDTAKFNSVVGALDATTIEDLQDIIKSKPDTDAYKTLKEAIIKRTTESPDSTLLKLLTNLELGDSKPSQLWRKMKSMAGDKILDAALKVMWLAHLPAPAQTYLSLFKVDSIDDLLEAADKLITHNTQVSSVNATETTSCASSGYSTPARGADPVLQQLVTLQASMAQLIALMRQSVERAPQAPQRNGSRRGRARERSNSRQRGRSPANRTDWCWYHNKYGASAINCTKPCNFQPSSSGN